MSTPALYENQVEGESAVHSFISACLFRGLMPSRPIWDTLGYDLIVHNPIRLGKYWNCPVHRARGYYRDGAFEFVVWAKPRDGERGEFDGFWMATQKDAGTGRGPRVGDARW
jgi:hypothetical protein